jgi:PAS domain S-box-containing protein
METIEDKSPAQNQLSFLVHPEELPGYVWITDQQGRYVYCNKKVCEYTGKTSEELSQDGFCSTIHPDDKKRVVGERYRCVRARETKDLDFRWRCHDGSYRWFRNQVRHIIDAQGDLLRSYNLIFDIHEQKLAEQALVENERKFREIVDKAPTGIWMADEKGGITFGNQSIVNYTGETLAYWGGDGWNNCLHPEDAPIAWERWHACVDSGTSYRHAYRLRDHDGQYRWFQTAGEPLRDASGKIVSWIGAHTDIDDRVKAEEAIRESSEHLRLLIDTIPALVSCSTPDGAPGYFNKRMSEYTGYAGDHWQRLAEKVGEDDYPANRGWKDLIHPEDCEKALPMWIHSLSTGTPFTMTLRLRRADGIYRWFRMSAEPLRDSTGKIICWYGLNIDIDDNRQTEELLRITRTKLAKAAQLATVAELSAAIAHEINQPLAAVVANADACISWLAGSTPNLERARSASESISVDVHAAATVLSRVRSLFRQATPQKLDLNVNDVVHETLSLLREDLSRKNITIDLKLGSVKTVQADQVQLQQVLTNLIANAVDAMQTHSGSTTLLTISTTMREADVVIAIADRGPGVSEPEKIFESFFSSKETGLGMGLSISRSIVEAHGGVLWLEENSHEGATFAFSIPVE